MTGLCSHVPMSLQKPVPYYPLSNLALPDLALETFTSLVPSDPRGT